jgi:hypothetical protein
MRRSYRAINVSVEDEASYENGGPRLGAEYWGDDVTTLNAVEATFSEVCAMVNVVRRACNAESAGATAGWIR